MKIQPYIEKLEVSPEYKEFKQKYHDSFLVAGFFILDYETGQNMHQIDYYIPSEKKVAAFTLAEQIAVQILELMDERVPEQLDERTNIDLDALKGIIEDEMKNRSITEEIKKMIAVVQRVQGKVIWNVNCILSGMELLKSHVDDLSETVLKMERSSVMDYLKKIPAQGSMPAKAAKAITPEDIDKEIEKLDKLKEMLNKEKENLKSGNTGKASDEGALPSEPQFSDEE